MLCFGKLRRSHIWKFFLICIVVTLGISFCLNLIPLQDGYHDCPCNPSSYENENKITIRNFSKQTAYHKLAIIVPFRDRFEELLDFVPYMGHYLNLQKVSHKIFVINQVDNFRFNRAALINVGYLESKSECDYLAMHDVDLLPLNPNLSYAYPSKGPFHVAAPNLHPRYHYPKFVGGILLLTCDDFQKTRGLSNRYWGWGQEDDEFYVRMRKAGLNISRPQNITTGYKTFKHLHDSKKRRRDTSRFFNQHYISSHRDYETGFDTLAYEKVSQYDLSVNGSVAKVINIRLSCDLSKTPWCLQKQDHNLAKPYL
ncbi:beta-1,4-galactosyltransferase 7-like [Octopus sinensis]|uniref:Beta-1,4-galactosyltransferase n=1 Tax=Octopus sinensis TaxID=2607531 RepID=A0A6P7UBE7_9MOLL|nr:beta-1,4-galactosyltransferase 7-like [Octopus sinensis]XP_036355228.1 beta-1,4-galactosyltransferase 7-like [Octopus sinensis]